MKKINDTICERSVSFLLLLSLVVVFSFILKIDTSAAEATAGLKVNAASNYFSTTSTTVGKGEGYVTVTYFINSTKDMLNTQWTLTYDPTYLKFVESDNMNDANRSNLMPMVDALVWNADSGNSNNIKANASDLKLYKFAGKGFVPFITATFQVIGSGETDVNLNVEILTLSLPDSETQMTDLNQEEIVIDDGVVDETKVQTERKTSVYAGHYNPENNNNVSNDNTTPETSTTNIPTVTVTQDELQKNSVKLDNGISMKWKKNKITIRWKTISGADGYDIFATKCGAKMTSTSLVESVTGKQSSAALTKIAGKKLSDKEEYRIKINAYKLINGTKVYIGNSQIYHIAGKNNKKYTNAKKIKVVKKSVTLKKGKTTKIKATIVKQSNKKKLLGKGHGPALRYYSTDNSIATVTAKGKVKARKKGTCYIYITALNSVKTKVKVKVK